MDNSIKQSSLTISETLIFSVGLLGKAFVVSINNKYDHFGVGSSFYEGELSRVTSCNDSGGTFSVLKSLTKNDYIGLNTPTLITCGANPLAWEDAVKWGKCRAETLSSQKAHLHLGLYAFCLVKNKANEEKQTIYGSKQDLFKEQTPTQKQFLQCFTAFA